MLSTCSWPLVTETPLPCRSDKRVPSQEDRDRSRSPASTSKFLPNASMDTWLPLTSNAPTKSRGNRTLPCPPLGISSGKSMPGMKLATPGKSMSLQPRFSTMIVTPIERITPAAAVTPATTTPVASAAIPTGKPPASAVSANFNTFCNLLQASTSSPVLSLCLLHPAHALFQAPHNLTGQQLPRLGSLHELADVVYEPGDPVQ